WDLDCHTVLDGLRAVAADVVHDDGTDIERAADAASRADVAVVVVGCTYVDEGEYIGETDPSLVGLFSPADEPEVAARYQASLAVLPATTKPERLDARPRGAFGLGGDRDSLRLPAPDVA